VLGRVRAGELRVWLVRAWVEWWRCPLPSLGGYSHWRGAWVGQRGRVHGDALAGGWGSARCRRGDGERGMQGVVRFLFWPGVGEKCHKGFGCKARQALPGHAQGRRRWCQGDGAGRLAGAGVRESNREAGGPGLAKLGWKHAWGLHVISMPRPPLLSNPSLNHMMPKCMHTHVIVCGE
jgi:hypothetical protein